LNFFAGCGTAYCLTYIGSGIGGSYAFKTLIIAGILNCKGLSPSSYFYLETIS